VRRELSGEFAAAVLATRQVGKCPGAKRQRRGRAADQAASSAAPPPRWDTP
jgi:hypothetical protein